MKTIYKTIAIFLLAGTGVDSAQAQNGSSQTWTLRQCIDYAIEHNINIRQTANEAEQNKVDVNTAKWARLPNLSGSASQNWSWGLIRISSLGSTFPVATVVFCRSVTSGLRVS